MILLLKHQRCILREDRKLSCGWHRDICGTEAGNSILDEVNLVKGQLHEIDLTNVSELY